MANDKLEQIKRKYQQSLGSKADELEACLRKAESSFFSADSVSALRALVHKFGGSAGMYGYDDLAILAKDVEKDVAQARTDDAPWRDRVRDRVAFLVSSLRQEASSTQ